MIRFFANRFRRVAIRPYAVRTGGPYIAKIVSYRLTLEIENSRTPTAFKHPRCGGLLFMVEEPDRIYYQCDKCSAFDEEFEQLAVGKPVILRRTNREEPLLQSPPGQ